MRRSAVGRGSDGRDRPRDGVRASGGGAGAARALALLAASIVVASCAPDRAPRGTVASDLESRPACPRASAPDVSGRCACVDGTLAILGACVSPSTGDAYCGPGERLGVDGCGFTPCDPGRTLDLATGRCGPTWVEGSSAETALDACGPDATRLLDTDHGRRLCGTGDAGCPRGARRIGGVCVRSVRCPAGSLYDGHACRPIVGSAPSTRQVDVGLWAAIAIGTDGGLGSSDLCRPLEQEAQVFGAAGSVGGPPIRLRIDLEFPDQDLTRSTAAVEVRDAVGELLHGDAARSAERAVTTMFELLRSLGGEATAASVEVEVRCNLGSSAALEDAGAARKIKQTPGDAGDTDGAPELPSP